VLIIIHFFTTFGVIPSQGNEEFPNMSQIFVKIQYVVDTHICMSDNHSQNIDPTHLISKREYWWFEQSSENLRDRIFETIAVTGFPVYTVGVKKNFTYRTSGTFTICEK